MGCWPCYGLCRNVESRIGGSHYLVALEEEEEEEEEEQEWQGRSGMNSRTATMMMMMVCWWQGHRVDNRNPNGLVDWARY